MFQAQNIHYDMASKGKGLHCAGLGAFRLLERQLDLATAINGRIRLLKRHVPYFESDHILNLTYNILAGGRTLNDLELLRTNEVYLDVLGAQRIPDPTTAGDFLRRFQPAHIDTLMNVINYLPRPLDLGRLAYLADLLTVRARYEAGRSAAGEHKIEVLGKKDGFLYVRSA